MLGDWAFENDIINPAKNKIVCFTKVQVIEPLTYSLQDTVIPEERSCKYYGIILCSDLSWAVQVNYIKKKPGRHNC
jgi:hypothetical protein